MKDLFNKYKVGFLVLLVVFVILTGFTTFRFIKAAQAVKMAIAEKEASFSETDINDAGWFIPEIQEKKKEIHWVERQLILAKSDSLNLGINLADSIVQVQLKGTVLLQANILKQIPAHFFESTNYAYYLDFTSIPKIVEEKANILKRPVKKVQAPKNENEYREVKHDTIPDPELVWQFVLDNQVEVIITGVATGQDSLIHNQYKGDFLKYSFDKLNKNWIPKNYMPTLYIWLSDKDAKAIYRAIPPNGRVVFRI